MRAFGLRRAKARPYMPWPAAMSRTRIGSFESPFSASATASAVGIMRPAIPRANWPQIDGGLDCCAALVGVDGIEKQNRRGGRDGIFGHFSLLDDRGVV